MLHIGFLNELNRFVSPVQPSLNAHLSRSVALTTLTSHALKQVVLTAATSDDAAVLVDRLRQVRLLFLMIIMMAMSSILSLLFVFAMVLAFAVLFRVVDALVRIY